MNKCIDCKYLNGSSSHCNSEVFCSKEIDELNADAYQQGRKDALDEVILQVSEYQDRNKYAFPEKRQKPFEIFFHSTTNAIIRMIEYMKEQKDDARTTENKDNE